MPIAYIETTCHCDEHGFEAFVYDDTLGDLRPALAHEDPILRLKCGTCGGTRHMRIAVALTQRPVERLSFQEREALCAELDAARDEIAAEEATRPYVAPSLLERHDALRRVVELDVLEAQITVLERRGALVWPGMLQRREELRAAARELLAPAS